jgi:two-component system, cell cycle sensor histidine kinase and response regulator CckA
MILADQLDHLKQICGDGIRVCMDAHARPALIEADRESVEQIVLTLVLNARDAMPDGGVLTLTTANAEPDQAIGGQDGRPRPGSYVLVEVSDSGCGIDPAMIDRIFEPFFTTKPTGHGTGLGLPAVHGLVKQHHGVVRCHSELGRGTAFRVYLPGD